MDAITTGIISGVATEHVKKVLPGDESPFILSAMLDEQREAVRLLRMLTKALTEEPEPPFVTILNLSAFPRQETLNHFGRKHTQIFSPTNTLVLYLDIPGMGFIEYTCVAGWQQLDLPEQTKLSLKSDNTSIVNVLFRATNTNLGA